MAVAARKHTWEDIRDLPESAGRTEIVNGELVMSPTPSYEHQEIATSLGAVIHPFVRRKKLGRFFSCPVHVVLAEHVNYEPDLCFVSREHLSILRQPVIAGAPDLIIEIISESNRTHDTVVKFRDYEDYGVREYWLVDPRERHIRVHSLRHGRYELLGVFGPGERVVTEVFAGLELNPAEVFPEV